MNTYKILSGFQEGAASEMTEGQRERRRESRNASKMIPTLTIMHSRSMIHDDSPHTHQRSTRRYALSQASIGRSET